MAAKIGGCLIYKWHKRSDTTTWDNGTELYCTSLTIFLGQAPFFLVTVHIFLLPMVSFFLPFMHYYQDTLQLRLETMIRLISSNTEGPNIKRILGHLGHFVKTMLSTQNLLITQM